VSCVKWRQMASHGVAIKACQALGRGVTRSKRKGAEWLRKAAENGYAHACLDLATQMYLDQPYAREVGHVGETAGAGVATSAEIMEGHDIPPDVLTGVVHWLRKCPPLSGGRRLHSSTARLNLSRF